MNFRGLKMVGNPIPRAFLFGASSTALAAIITDWILLKDRVNKNKSLLTFHIVMICILSVAIFYSIWPIIRKIIFKR